MADVSSSSSSTGVQSRQTHEGQPSYKTLPPSHLKFHSVGTAQWGHRLGALGSRCSITRCGFTASASLVIEHDGCSVSTFPDSIQSSSAGFALTSVAPIQVIASRLIQMAPLAVCPFRMDSPRRISGIGCDDHMRWFHAPWMIAEVVNDQPKWNVALGCHEGIAMRTYRFITAPEDAVALLTIAAPLPTVAARINFHPEMGISGGREASHHFCQLGLALITSRNAHASACVMRTDAPLGLHGLAPPPQPPS